MPERVGPRIGDQQRGRDLRDLLAEGVGLDRPQEPIAGPAVHAVGAPERLQPGVQAWREQLGHVHLAVERNPGTPPQRLTYPLGQVLPPASRDVHHPGVRHRGREAMLEGQRAGHPVAALAEADHGHVPRVDVGARCHRVRDGRQDSLPVGARRDPLLEQHRLLPRSVEGHPVVAPLAGLRAGVGPHLRGRAVAAVVHHEQRAGLPRLRVGRAEEVPG